MPGEATDEAAVEAADETEARLGEETAVEAGEETMAASRTRWGMAMGEEEEEGGK